MKLNINRNWAMTTGGFLAILMGIFAAAYMRMVPVKLASVPFYDSIGHATLYGILAFFLNLALNGRHVQFPHSRLRIPLALLLVIAFGALDELLQTMSPFRTADLHDFAADVLGAIIFISLSFHFLTREVKLR